MEPNEQWRPVPKSDYEVSDLGNVRNVTTGTMRKFRVNPGGYLACNLQVAGIRKTVRIHCLVAEVFLGSRPNGMTINHCDGNKKNNRAENLEYVTIAENLRHAKAVGLSPRGSRKPLAKLTDEAVRSIREEVSAGTPRRELAARYGVNRRTIGHVINGTGWAHVSR